MKTHLLAAAVALAAVPPALAADSNLGRNLAATCANCHGTDGRSPADMPKLAGLDKARTVQLMKEFREGKRPATIMHQISKGYSERQVELIAEYFATRKP